jgi:4-amino-4-deoxy-L-arabinose transferase-like glycosyltransferase
MTSKQHTLIAFLLISALLSFFRIDLPGMTNGEEDFSLHWGILSIFGTTPFTADSWGAFADQAPYLSLGKSPFVNPPLPMWAMVAWTQITSQTLPNTRILSAMLAMIAVFSMFFIAKRFLKADHALFAPGFLAGSLLWNDAARHATPEIWGITFFLMSMAFLLSIIFQKQKKISSLILMSIGLCISTMILMISSFTGVALFILLMIPILFFFNAQKFKFHFASLSIILGLIGGYSWYHIMDFPYFSQILDSILLAKYIPAGLDFNTLIIDFALFPFFASGLIIGIKRLRSTPFDQSKSFLFLLIWFIISYVLFGFSAMIIPPFALIGLNGLLAANVFIQSHKIRWTLIAYALLLSCFGIAPRLIEAMSNGIFQQEWSAIGIIPLILLIGIPFSSMFMGKETLAKLTYSAMSRALITLVIAALIKVAFANLLGKTRIEPNQLVRIHERLHHSNHV